MQEHIRAILTQLGEDPKREGLIKTPERVERLLRTLTSANQQSLETFINAASLFPSTMDEMILIKGIAFYSLCEHHLLPFIGYCYVAYIPNGKIIGLSKIPQLVDFYARRLQIQENLTQQIAENLLRILNAKGVGVMIEAKHFCMMVRGIEKAEKKEASIRTFAMLGAFKNNKQIRSEFLGTLPSFEKKGL